MNLLREKSCVEFSAQLASKAPVPGGGGAAALTGALAAALCAMAANLTIGKKKFAAVEQDLIDTCSRLEDIRTSLLAAIDADAEAFAPLQKAYSIPKDDPTRAETIEKASVTAAMAPLEIMRLCADAVSCIEFVKNNCSALMISDVGCAASLASSCLQAAAMNVFVNTVGNQSAREIEAEAKHILSTVKPTADEIALSVTKRLLKED